MRVDDLEQPRPAHRRTARSGIQLGLWVAAAVGALLLGMTAVGSIGTGLGGGGLAQPLAAEDIEARLAAHGGPAPGPVPGGTVPGGTAPGGTDPAGTAPAAGAPAPGPAPEQPSSPVVVPAGPAGTVLARCDGATPRVVAANPAQGFEVEDDAPPGQVEFDGDDIEVRVVLSCANGVPSGQASVLVDDDD